MEYTLEECALDVKAIGQPPPPQEHNVISVRVLTMSLKTVKVNKNVLDVLVPINPQCPDKNKKSIKLKCSNCNGDHVASSRDCPKFKDQTKIQADRAKARQEKLQNNLVVRGITFSNIVQNKTEKVQSELTEKNPN